MQKSVFGLTQKESPDQVCSGSIHVYLIWAVHLIVRVEVYILVVVNDDHDDEDASTTTMMGRG